MLRLKVWIFFDPSAFWDRKKCVSVSRRWFKNKSATIGVSRCVYSRIICDACEPSCKRRNWHRKCTKLATEIHSTINKVFEASANWNTWASDNIAYSVSYARLLQIPYHYWDTVMRIRTNNFMWLQKCNNTSIEIHLPFVVLMSVFCADFVHRKLLAEWHNAICVCWICLKGNL